MEDARLTHSENRRATTLQRSGAAAEPTIRFHAVTKQYRGGGGVDEITLDVYPGEVFGFLGPNGAGKSTTIRLVLDLIRPDHGEITVLGLDVRRQGIEVRRQIGYLPGELTLYEKLTPRALLTHLAHLRTGVESSHFESLAKEFSLDLDRPIKDLSKGNRQKVGLIQALMGDPKVLILDEPTSGLDPLVQQSVHGQIRRACTEGRTVFLSSHVLSEVGQIADRVGLIREGRIIAIDDVTNLRRHSAHLIEAETDGQINLDDLRELPGVSEVNLAGRTLTFKAAGPLTPVMSMLASVDLLDLVVREQTLEELFLAFYAQNHAPS